MIKSIPLAGFLCLSILTISCEKRELPTAKFDRGDLLTVQVEMTPNYKNQVWFCLSENKVISTNHKTDWDIGFESSNNGFHIILNGAKSMRAFKTSFLDFAQVTDTVGLAVNGRADMPSGNLDSTAINVLSNENYVYIINRGYNEMGQLQGYFKLKIINVTATTYVFEYGDVFGINSTVHTLFKNNDYNFNMFSFSSNSSVIIEPKKTLYDLCFTQYTHVFSNPFQYYLVLGVLNNSWGTRLMKIESVEFKNISLADTAGRVFGSANNVIGFDWKSFDLNLNIFTVNPNYSFIINDSKGYYYKLHFIDFYNSSGLKGYPTFEFVKL